MTEEPTLKGDRLSGALIGWERKGSHYGCVVTLQIVESAAQHEDHQYHRVSMALNDRQLRSLARDLARAAQSRGMDIRAKPTLRQRMLTSFKALVG